MPNAIHIARVSVYWLRPGEEISKTDFLKSKQRSCNTHVITLSKTSSMNYFLIRISDTLGAEFEICGEGGEVNRTRRGAREKLGAGGAGSRGESAAWARYRF